MSLAGWIVIAVVALLVLWTIWAFNRLVKYRNRTDEGWAQIDVQLRRRYDLIPNLVQTVEGYAAHERETFEEVTKARSRAERSELPRSGKRLIPSRERDRSAGWASSRSSPGAGSSSKRVTSG